MDKTLKLVLILFILTLSGSVFYYFVIYMPGLSKSMIEQSHDVQKNSDKAELTNADRLEKCLNDAYEEYVEMWDDQCQLLEMQNDCKLLDSYAERVEDHLDKKEAHCRYKFDWEDEVITEKIIRR